MRWIEAGEWGLKTMQIKCGETSLRIIVLGALACLLLCNASYSAIVNESDLDEPEYKKDENEIARARQSGDLAKFKVLGDGLEQKWRGKDKQKHAELMLELCAPITSGRFGVNMGIDLPRRYALSALREPNTIAVETEVKLAQHVVTYVGPGVPHVPTGQDWAAKRKEDVTVRLHAWQRLIDEIGPPLGPEDAYTMYVKPPPGAAPNFPVSPVPPEAIKDAKLRAQYEAAIAENNRKAARFLRHHDLEELLRRFTPWAEKYIVEAYSRPPLDSKELDQLLRVNLKDEATRTRILDAVRKRTEGR